MPLSYLVLALLVTCCQAKPERVPLPHDPNGPINYPADYCQIISENEQFDYIVVGAGPAGASTSRRLAEDKKVRVLLVEAGDDPITSSDIPTGRAVTANELWDMQTQPSSQQCAGYPGNSCKYVYPKFLGGASVVNLMMYARGNHRDYDEWGSAAGCAGWSWNDMFPYFLKLENYKDPQHLAHPDLFYHRSGGPFTTTPSQIDPQSNEFRDAFQQSIIHQNVPFNSDVNGKSQIGVGSVTGLLAENGYRNNVAKAYLLDIPDNMKVCKRSIVNRVIITGKVATAVEFVYNGTETRTVRASKDIVLSGGALGTPQILERSGLGNPAILAKAGVPLVQEMPGVGENLQEQFTNLGCAFSVDFQTESARNPLSIALTSLTIFLNMTDYNNPVPDLQWYFVPYSPNYMMFKPEIGAQYMAISNVSYVLMAGSVILRQSNRGYVHITSSDPNTSPEYNPNQFTSEYETFLTTEGCRLMRSAMSEPKMQKFNPQPIVLDECKQYEFNSPEEIMCQARLVAYPAYHMAGGARMGSAKDKMAVVDNKLRVHGIKGLRVADLSVMPGVPRANTEVPSMAIGEKAADVIKRDSVSPTVEKWGYEIHYGPDNSLSIQVQ